MIAYKNVLLTPVMRLFINVFMPYSQNKKPAIAPKPAKAIYDVTAFYFTPKRGNYEKREQE